MTACLRALQDGNYPKHLGKVSEIGSGAGVGTNLNIPLPPGSGNGAYAAAFERVLKPAVQAFAPDLILVSSGKCQQDWTRCGCHVIAHHQ